MSKWFEVELSVVFFGYAVSLSTPSWAREYHLPSWRPRWELIDLGDVYAENRYLFFFDWFFHLTAAWGVNAQDSPEKVVRSLQP